MRRLALVAAAAALALPAVAWAGGWATVKLSSAPTGAVAGAPWKVRITVLQHGVTPLDDVKPFVRIRKGQLTKTFPARPTAATGVYAARVVFPGPGVWRYSVWDGFVAYGGARTHAYAPVRVAAAPGA
ncbi:MAG TPA: hypothetical protein VH950_08990 [Gaiellaceae bacterium]